MLYTLHYTTDLFHICKIQWNTIKDEMSSINSVTDKGRSAERINGCEKANIILL